MKVNNRYFFSYLCTIILMFSHDAMASDDEYMKLMEAEAAETHLDLGGQRKSSGAKHNISINTQKRDWPGECDYTDDVLPSGLVWEEFPSYLKQCYLGTYVFYRRLELNLQHSVYDAYLKTAPIKLSALKKEISNYF